MALLAGLSFPAASSGLDAMRLRSAGSRVVNFLDTAVNRADRLQQVVEIRISPAENALFARTADLSFDRAMTLPDSIRIASVQPALIGSADSNEVRRFLVYPGGTAPRIVVDLVSPDGRKRRVIVDPLTGMPRLEAVTP